MIETGLLIYLYTVFLGLADFFKWFIPVFIIFAPFAYFVFLNAFECAGVENARYIKATKKLKIPVLIFICIGACIPMLVPDKEDIKWIIGGTLAVEAAKGATQLEGIDKLPQNLVDAMNAFLEQVSEPEVLKNELD